MSFAILLESGSALLLESGFALLLEASVDLSADLAGAIQQAYAAAIAADPSLSDDIYNGVASDNAAYPHVVFRVASGSPAFQSSSSYWTDRRIRFDCMAERAVAARLLADALADYLGGAGGTEGISLRWQDGVTAPLVLANAQLGAEKVRGKGNSRVFRSTVEYSARARLGVPVEEA